MSDTKSKNKNQLSMVTLLDGETDSSSSKTHARRVSITKYSDKKMTQLMIARGRVRQKRKKYFQVIKSGTKKNKMNITDNGATL